MGLCKCPKRKVANIFCFEHRVNVCEHCMVKNHARVRFRSIVRTLYLCSSSFESSVVSFQCVVQSYLLWLQDSDYSSDCPLCTRPLADEECVRLVNYREKLSLICISRSFEKSSETSVTYKDS